jgi:pilus assembly protein TadC
MGIMNYPYKHRHLEEHVPDKLLNYYFRLKQMGKSEADIRKSLEEKKHSQQAINWTLSRIEQKERRLKNPHLLHKRILNSKVFYFFGLSMLIIGLSLLSGSLFATAPENFLSIAYALSLSGLLIVGRKLLDNRIKKHRVPKRSY